MRRLVVGSAILALTAATLSWTWADDQEIARKVAERLKQEQKEGNLQGFDINLKVAEGRLTLKGDVASDKQKDAVIAAVSQIEGVKAVVNEIQVKTPAKPAGTAAGEATSTRTPAKRSLLSGLWSGGSKASAGDVKQAAEVASPKTKPSDPDLAQQVAAALKQQRDAGGLKGFNIDLSVKDAVVTLDGRVSSDEQAQLATRTTRDIAGVRDVISHLVVSKKDSSPSVPQDAEPEAVAAKDEAQSGTSGGTASLQASSTTPDPDRAAEDRRIGKELSQRLQELKDSGQLHGFGIAVHVENGYVWLKGRVGSTGQQQTTLDLARRIPGVRQVINDLSVGEPPATIAQNLSSRLRSAEASGLLRGSNLNVKVDGPDVWLTGTASTPEQEKLAVDLARQVPGVRRVISGVNVQGTSAASQLAMAASATPRPPAALPSSQRNATASPRNVASLPSPAVTRPTADKIREAAAEAPGSQPSNLAFTAKRTTTSPAPASTQLVAAAVPQAVAANANPVPQPVNQPPVAVMPAVDQTPRPLGVPQLAGAAGALATAPLAAIAGATGMAPAQLPGPGYAVVPARYDHPSLPGYAWPTYAAYPNYAAVTYPRQYSASAWPYIGPFYPYPQVPLGWRKVTLKWDDGWWNLDFKAK